MFSAYKKAIRDGLKWKIHGRACRICKLLSLADLF